MTRGRQRPTARLCVLAACAAAALVAPRCFGRSLAAADPAPRADAADRAADRVADRAAAAVAALRFDEALQLADQAWRSGDNGPDQLRRIFALAGRAAGSIGEDRAARLWFSRWLYLDPDANLPDGTSPKLTALLGVARATLAGAALTCHATAHPGAVRVTVAGDPLALVAAVRAGTIYVALEDGAAVVPVTAAVREVEIVDRHGNRLAAIGIQPAAEPATAPARDAARAWYAHPVTWAVATGVLVAAGGAGLWIAIDARNEIDEDNRNSANLPYNRPLQSRFDAAQIAAPIAFGAAAVTAIVGATLWLRGRGEPTVTAAPGAASVAWRLAF